MKVYDMALLLDENNFELIKCMAYHFFIKQEYVIIIFIFLEINFMSTFKKW